MKWSNLRFKSCIISNFPNLFCTCAPTVMSLQHLKPEYYHIYFKDFTHKNIHTFLFILIKRNVSDLVTLMKKNAGRFCLVNRKQHIEHNLAHQTRNISFF